MIAPDRLGRVPMHGGNTLLYTPPWVRGQICILDIRLGIRPQHVTFPIPPWFLAHPISLRLTSPMLKIPSKFILWKFFMVFRRFFSNIIDSWNLNAFLRFPHSVFLVKKHSDYCWQLLPSLIIELYSSAKPNHAWGAGGKRGSEEELMILIRAYRPFRL